MSLRSLAHPFDPTRPVVLPHPRRASVLTVLGGIGLVAVAVMWLNDVRGVWFAFLIATDVVVLASGLSLWADETRAERASTPELQPSWSADALARLSRRWTRLPGRDGVDEVLVSSAGVFAVTTKFTSTDWSLPSPALERVVVEAKQHADRVHVPAVTPVLIVWGPGAPTIPGGWELHGDVVVCRGSADPSWRAHLEALPDTLEPVQVRRLVARLRRS
jgi:hypothetical protein